MLMDSGGGSLFFLLSSCRYWKPHCECWVSISDVFCRWLVSNKEQMRDTRTLQGNLCDMFHDWRG